MYAVLALFRFLWPSHRRSEPTMPDAWEACPVTL
jgi:hypothetical protein